MNMNAVRVLRLIVLAWVLGPPMAVMAEPLVDQHPKLKVQNQVPLRAYPFDLRDVRLLDGPFRQAQELDRQYLLSLDADRLLHTFRLNAGLPSQAEPLGGWEEPTCEVRGHSLGHYLSACSLMVASTGDRDLKQRVDYLVAELAKCQDRLGNGYLSAFPEEFFDRVENFQRVWAPYYTLHKIFAGLLDAYVHCDNSQALTVATEFGDWAAARNARLSDDQMQKMLGNEHGGMNETLANLYALTGDERHLQTAQRFNHLAVVEPPSKGEDRLNGLHANTQVPKFVGTARQYELTGEPWLRAASKFFWETVALKRSYVIGGHSDHEHFFPVEEFSKQLSPATAETCNTHNMLKLTRHMFAWEPSATAMDFYERALFNQILASQEPRGGMMAYFIPLKPGHFMVYNTPTDSFWCCTGTGIENHGKYGDTIFFHDDRSLLVNLFISAEVTWREKGLVLRQETRFPEADTTRLTFRRQGGPPSLGGAATENEQSSRPRPESAPVPGQQPESPALKIRWPAWARAGMQITINGEQVAADGTPGSYVTLQRQWQDGDCVEVRLPMSLRIEAMPDDPRMVALLYGPIVLAGELGTAGLENLSLHLRSQLDLARVPTPAVPALVCEPADLLTHVEPLPDRPLTFRTRGIGRPQDVTLVPLYRLHYQRYAVYWKLLTDDQWQQREAELAVAEREQRELTARTVDAIRPNDPQVEADHKLQGERMAAGDFQDRSWRHAAEGGWFSYELKVLPSVAQELRITYWGSDSGPRVFDVLVDGVPLATQRLQGNRPGEFFDEVHPLSAALTQGKERITVKFQAHPGATAGGVFGIRVLREK
jgi:hypothetical protein